MTEIIVTLIRGFRRSIKDFTYSSFLSLVVIALILLILFKMDQAYTMMLYMLEEDKFSLFLCFIYVNALALTLSHYPIYTYYSKGFNNSKGVVSWQDKRVTLTFFKKYKLSYPYFIYNINKDSNYKMSVTANVLRYTLGIFIYAVWVIFIYKSVRPNLLFNDHLGIPLKAIAWIIGVFFSFPIIIYAILKYRIVKNIITDKTGADNVGFFNEWTYYEPTLSRHMGQSSYIYLKSMLDGNEYIDRVITEVNNSKPNTSK